MAQSALLEPSWLPHPNDGYLQDQPQELASILRHVVAEQDGNTNPTHHAILFLMELCADMGGKYLVFVSSRSVKMKGFSFLSF